MPIRFSSKVIFALAVAVIFWGSAPPAIRAALQGYSPAHLALLRFALATVLLTIYAIIAGLRPPALRDIPVITLAGGIGITFYNTVLNYGLLTVRSAEGSFLIASTPIWTALIAFVVLHERLNHWGWAGIFISFAGIGIIAHERAHGLHFSRGALVLLAGAISYAIYMVMQKRLLGRYQALEFTVYAFWAGTLLMLPFSGGALHAARIAPVAATAALVYLGVFPAAIANVAWAYAMSHTTATRISTFIYLMPVVAVLLGWVWLGEVPSLLSLVGGGLALAGVALVNWKGHVRQMELSPLPEMAD